MELRLVGLEVLLLKFKIVIRLFILIFTSHINRSEGCGCAFKLVFLLYHSKSLLGVRAGIINRPSFYRVSLK